MKSQERFTMCFKNNEKINEPNIYYTSHVIDFKFLLIIDEVLILQISCL